MLTAMTNRRGPGAHRVRDRLKHLVSQVGAELRAKGREPSQRAIAKEIGLSESGISRLNTKEQPVNVDTLFDVMERTGLSASFFFDDTIDEHADWRSYRVGAHAATTPPPDALTVEIAGSLAAYQERRRKLHGDELAAAESARWAWIPDETDWDVYLGQWARARGAGRTQRGAERTAAAAASAARKLRRE